MIGQLIRAAGPLIAAQALRYRFKRFFLAAAFIATAVIFFGIALVFGLIALHQWLMSLGFTSIETALLLSIGFVGIGILILAVLALERRFRYRRSATGSHVSSTLEGMSPQIASIGQRASKIMDRVGPVKLLAIAFTIGLAASQAAKSKR